MRPAEANATHGEVPVTENYIVHVFAADQCEFAARRTTPGPDDGARSFTPALNVTRQRVTLQARLQNGGLALIGAR
jgi:hypothetical protein